MAENDKASTEIVSTRLSQAAAHQLGEMAQRHGLSLAAFLRELVDAANEERVIFKGPLRRNDSRECLPRTPEDAAAARRRARADVVTASLDGAAAREVREAARDSAATVAFEG